MASLAHGFRRGTDVRKRVYEALGELPTERAVIAARTGLSPFRVSSTLTTMKTEGLVLQVSRGYWKAVPMKDWPATRGKHTGPPRTGEANHAWRGGRYTNSDGYVLVKVGTDHPMADVRGYAYEHRLVASTREGRTLQGNELVHHDDEDPGNNAPSNLEIVSRAEHKVRHRRVTRSDGLARRLPGEENTLVSCSCGCGEHLRRFDSAGRPRRFISGHNIHPKEPR